MSGFALDGVRRDYAWGSRSAIPALLGEPPSDTPVAELWFGDHPSGPSRVPERNASLDEIVAADPVGMLGPSVLSGYGAHLPFLLKILAAERALSTQVHPTKEQAAAAFAAGDPNYSDANHKPELLYALTPFDALCGFRPVAETLELLAALDLPELAFVADLLRGADGLRAAFTDVLAHPRPSDLVDALTPRLGADERLAGVRLAATDFPGDIGVLLAVLLNHVRLEPGQAIYLGAGNVHSYLRGTGVEIMASSDNVLRCGLTTKPVDVPELLKIADCTELPEPRWPSVDGVFAVPVPDFRLAVVDVEGPGEVAGAGPRIVLCLSGEVRVGDLVLTPARAAFLAHGDRPALSGSGRVAVASTG